MLDRNQAAAFEVELEPAFVTELGGGAGADHRGRLAVDEAVVDVAAEDRLGAAPPSRRKKVFRAA